jgi:hypothetical protein
MNGSIANVSANGGKPGGIAERWARRRPADPKRPLPALCRRAARRSPVQEERGDDDHAGDISCHHVHQFCRNLGQAIEPASASEVTATVAAIMSSRRGGDKYRNVPPAPEAAGTPMNRGPGRAGYRFEGCQCP